jgi:hypothetical protein
MGKATPYIVAGLGVLVGLYLASMLSIESTVAGILPAKAA